MKALLDWIKEKAGDNLLHLNKGASYSDIEAVESETGLRIPEDFKEFLKLHDGEDGVSWLAILGDGNQLLPCRSIISQYRLDQELGKRLYDPQMETVDFWKDRTDSGVIFVEGPVKPLTLHPKWLPMTCMNGNVFRYFDYDPAPGGIVGQIIEVDPENCSYGVIANSFTDLLEKYLSELQNGIYEIDDEHFIERAVEKEIAQGIPEWLKNA